MKKILWVSRHAMTDDQKNDLLSKFGEVTIIQHDSTVNDINDILRYESDVYAVVLSLDLIAKLKKVTSCDIIQPVSGRVATGGKIWNKATGGYESEYIYKHLFWQRIVRIELETERL